MKLTAVRIRNYRALESLDLAIGDYSALVGANGAGKSSVLNALNWFFTGEVLDLSDVTNSEESETAVSVSVTLTFSKLSPHDREVLHRFADGRRVARFRRTWTTGGKPRFEGEILQPRAFTEVLEAKSASELKRRYAGLRKKSKELQSLPVARTGEEVKAALAQWKWSGRRDSTFVDAASLLEGQDTLASLFQLVLVPGAIDMVGQFSADNRHSAMAQLVGAVASSATKSVIARWSDDNQDAIKRLQQDMEADVGKAVREHQEQVNELLKVTVPEATVSFSSERQRDWQVPLAEPRIGVSITVDKTTTDVTRQGHGLQRALIIALLRALATNQASSSKNSSQPSRLVCIEEPELYQHPVRARALARTLQQLSKDESTQVLIATHSPYFVTPESYESIRRFRLIRGRTTVSEATLESVGQVLDAHGHDGKKDSLKKFVERELPRTFSEAFFADAVVLVEGDTDRVILEALGEILGKPFDLRGIAIVSTGGKPNMIVPHALITRLEIPVYLVADGDFKTASGGKKAKRAQARQSHQDSTTKLAAWLHALCDQPAVSQPYAFGQATHVGSKYTFWLEDLEDELGHWESFTSSLKKLGGVLRDKDVAKYRAAALEALESDIPQNLKALVHAIQQIA